MSRIPLLSVEEAEKRAAEIGVPPNLARLNAFRALLHNSNATGSIAKLLLTLLFQGSIDHRTRELVILRMGWRTKSEYEFCQHVVIARQTGMPEAEILGVREPESYAGFSDVDRAVLALTDELVEGTRVTDETWAVLASAFEPGQLLELVFVAGNWRMFAGFLRSAQVPLDADVPSWPDGRKP
ncbi:MAG: carboxymuconolactone decarboxylase family protein [Candidatus Binatia bacterium]